MKTFRIKVLRAAGWLGSTLVIAFAAVLSGGCDVGSFTGSTPADAPTPTESVHVQFCDWGSCDTPPDPTVKPGPIPTDSAGNPLW